MSPAMNQLRQTIEKVAPTNSRVMIIGPSGAGKEQVARAIHALSARKTGPFVSLNAATITPERMEMELFGTEPNNGAGRRVGALEEAHGGTLYLDEVADMPRETQSKILRVLVDQQFQRVGGTKRVKVDVRIVSSTARNLEKAEIAEGASARTSSTGSRSCRSACRRLPSAARTSRTWSTISSTQISRQTGLPPRPIADDALAVLQAHDWPGNVRQLRNNVERLLILARGEESETITAEHLPAEIGEMMPAHAGGQGTST